MKTKQINFLIILLLLCTCCDRPVERMVPPMYEMVLDDSRVILQGFYWESYRHGHTVQFPEITSGQANIDLYWYEIVKEKAPEIKSGRFDIIWLPPPSNSGGGAGYSPTELYRLTNMYGDSLMHRVLLEALWQNGIEPIADIVLNHRNGSGSWAGFQHPKWDTRSICRSDEAFTNAGSEVNGTPVELRGNEEEKVDYDLHRERTYAYPAFRDIDHTNEQVNRDVVNYLLMLKTFGYRGWRYDMVHGYHASHIRYYNSITKPSFSVGEYDWDKQDAQRGWIWESSFSAQEDQQEHFRNASAVFDFSTYFVLKDNIGSGSGVHTDYSGLYNENKGPGLLGDNTDGIAWKQKSVTFLENHDTGWRTNEDGSTQEHHEFDSFENNRQVEQGYAYILTHPGIPCVFWKHYFDWGEELQEKIKALIHCRKLCGVHSGSSYHIQQNAAEAGVYAAMVEGTQGKLCVRIGGNDDQWKPSASGYQDFTEYLTGEDWKVWITLNNHEVDDPFDEYPLNNSLGELPRPIAAEKIPF